MFHEDLPRYFMPPAYQESQSQMLNAYKENWPGTGNCTYLARDMQRQNPGSRTIRIEHKARDGRGLGALPGRAQTKSGDWGHHEACELPDGRVLDADQGRVYKDRKEWMGDLVEQDKVKDLHVDTDPPEKPIPKWY